MSLVCSTKTENDECNFATKENRITSLTKKSDNSFCKRILVLLDYIEIEFTFHIAFNISNSFYTGNL